MHHCSPIIKTRKTKKKIKVAIRNSKLNDIKVTNFTRTEALNRTTELSILIALV